jgi:hypothetical protein
MAGVRLNPVYRLDTLTHPINLSHSIMDTPNDYVFRGETLKRRVISSVTDGEALRTVSRNPSRYKLLNDEFRPNMLKARDDALASKLDTCSAKDAWVQDILRQWCAMSGLMANDADFWRAPEFMDAVRNGRDIHLKRYLDEDGWAWIVVRDSPTYWLNKRRIPEGERLLMVAAAERRKRHY